jgi:hypothetical protein
MPEIKSRVLVCVLTGSERHFWINPELCETLIAMSKDERFAVTVQMVTQRWVDRARNVAVVAARTHGADWLIQIDNDVVPPSDLLDIIAEADKYSKQIVGLSYAVFQASGLQVIPVDNGPKDGDFRQSGCVGAGVLAIRSNVWETIPGPWFRWLSNDDECTTLRIGEDYHFCELAQTHGFTVWTHRKLVKHLRSADITFLALQQ